MTLTLIRKSPRTFKTLPLVVDANADRLTYQGVGRPLNFTEMMARRRPIEIADPDHFRIELANLGVSVRLTLSWQGRDYWVLVRQRRADRGDEVLKFISGYVPSQELRLPLLTAIQEVAEECLPETAEGWLCGRFGPTWLPAPYQDALNYHPSHSFRLSPLSGAARAVHCETFTLLERPRAYVHLPTASLQLVYDMHLELPQPTPCLSLFHVDERLEGERLVARLDRRHPGLYLIPLEQGRCPTDQLFTLTQDRLRPVDTRGIWLAESFAQQQGWLVREERVRWRTWIQRVRNLSGEATLGRA